MFNFKFKVRIALFDLLDLGEHSLKYPLDCSKREKKIKLESLEWKSRQPADSVRFFRDSVNTQTVLAERIFNKSYKNERLSVLNASHLLNASSWTLKT